MLTLTEPDGHPYHDGDYDRKDHAIDLELESVPS